MSMYRTEPLEPKNGVLPVVLNLARISGCSYEDDSRRWWTEHRDGLRRG